MLDAKLITGIAAAAIAVVISVSVYNQTRSSAPQPATASDTKTNEQGDEASESIMPPPMFDLDPPKDDVFTVEQLRLYDGSNEERPVFVAIKGGV